MKNTLGKRIICLILIALFTLTTVFTVGANESVDSSDEGVTDYVRGPVSSADAMPSIQSAFDSYRLGNVQTLANDGHIGIPVYLSVYYKASGNVKSGAGGTPIILYVVNTPTVRTGTETDTSIIASMLDRGYVVVVADYKYNSKAVSPALDWSAQSVRNKMMNGDFFSSLSKFTQGVTYYETFIVPSGHNVSLNHVYWEFDKHGADGSFENIVAVWNTDFRKVKGETIIKWTDSSGKKKAVQNAYDGTTPSWCNADGTANANGQYIKIKYTKASTITDCVKKDGSPIDLNLYMHIVYPTSPKNSVPVMALNSSAENLAKGAATLDRPQAAGFAFNGYASVMFDFGYVPMARDDHYGFFGAPITGDALSYAVHFYSDKLIGTAAMRYIRYLSFSDARFDFDTEAIGVYGNSKGGWMTYLGEEHPEKLTAKRMFTGHHGETRYENNKRADSGVIDGGEPQPWLTYDGSVIDSGADFIYASCGGLDENMTAGHAPTYVSCNMDDPSYYTSSNGFVNMCRIYDIPCLWFEIQKGHTLASGRDITYNIDTYQALFDFANFYLKKEPVKLLYTDLPDGEMGVSLGREIFFMFSGGVSKDQIEKLTPMTDSGEKALGEWTSAYGGTYWTFSPKLLISNEPYTVSIPKSFYGTNKVRIENEKRFCFITEPSEVTDNNFKTTSKGTYTWFTVENSNEYTLRAYVENNAANRLQLYSLTSFNSNDPDASTVGELIGEKIVSKSGNVEFDITDHCKSLPEGTNAAFLLKQSKTSGVVQGMNITFDGGNYGGVQIAGNILHQGATAPDGSTALEITEMQTNTKYTSLDAIYNNITTIAAKHGPIRAGTSAKYTEADIGRKYIITFRVYDTFSRTMQVYIKSPTSEADGISDYGWAVRNFYTEPNKWVDVELEYVIYEPAIYPEKEFGIPSMIIKGAAMGNVTSPLYIDSLKAVEVIDDVDISSVSISASNSIIDALSIPTSESLSKNTLSSIAKKSHPYILYEESEIGALKEKIKSGYSAKAFKLAEKMAKNYMKASNNVYYNSDSDKSTPVIGRLLQSQVAYLNTYSILTGDEQYAKKAVELVVAAANQGNTDIYYGINGGLCVSDFGYAYAIAYDWLYSYLTADQKTLLRNEMEEIGEWIYYYSLNPSGTEIWGDESPENLVPRKAWNWNAITHGALGLISVSLGKDTDHNVWLTRSIDRMKGYYEYSIDAQGCAFEGVHYIGYALNTLSVLDDLICDMTGVELLDYYPNVYNLTNWSMRMNAPYGNEQVGLGQGSKLDNYSALLYIITKGQQRVELWGWERTYNLYDGGEFSGDYAGNGFNAPNVIFFEDQSLTPLSPLDSMPLITEYERGLVIARDGWEADDSLMTFFSGWGRKGTWNHPDNNTFTFFAKGESFIIDLGANFKTSKEHNVVLVDGTGFYYDAPYMIAGSLLANKQLGNGALYVKGENSDSYRDTVLTESRRQLLYMGGETPYVIAYDHVKSTSSTHTYTTSFFTDLESKIEIIDQNTAKITGANSGAVAYAFVYSAEGATLSAAKTEKTNAVVTENKAVTHDQVTLYITANPDGSIPDVSFSTGSDGKIKVTVKYYKEESLFTDVYTLSDSGEPTSLTASASPEETEYGTIPLEYADKAAYPFVVFKSDKTFVGAYADWAIDAKASALHSAKASGSVILMRRDYNYTGGQYNNLSQTNTGIIIDLGGFNFTSTVRSFLTAQKKTNYDTGITVKNGRIVISSAALIKMDTKSSSGGVDYQGKNGFDLTFENVEIALDAYATTTDVISYNAFTAETPAQFCNLTFNNCTIDLTEATRDLVLFNMSDSRCRINASINGGEIKTSGKNVSPVSATVGNADSSIHFGKAGSDYTRLTVPKGSAAPFTTANGGLLELAEISRGTKTVTYIFKLINIESFYTPKMSITLEKDLIINVYVPKASLSKFAIDGKMYSDLGALKNNLISKDGTDYYLIPVSLIASRAAKTVELEVTLNIDNTDVVGSFAFNIITYSEEIIASGNDKEIALVKDILSYVRAAYIYFENSDTEAISRIDSIIGKSYDASNPPALSGGTSISTPELIGATLILNATPTLRFYISGNAASYIFYSGGAALDAQSGSDKIGNYIDIAIAACDMRNEITYTVNGAQRGSYNVNSYYNFVTTDSAYKTDSALTNLVARFIRYCESAESYKSYLSQK